MDCAAVTIGELGGRGFSNQLHPHPAFLPIFDYPGVTRGDALAKMAAVGSAHFKPGIHCAISVRFQQSINSHCTRRSHAM